MKPGELWLNATCRGRGELVVSFEPMGRFTIPCSDVVQPSANQMTQANSGELTLSVTATEGVEWSLRAQQ